LLALYLVAFFVYLESPLVIVFLTSLNKGLTVTFPPTGLSAQWYVRLWDHIREASGVKPGLVTSLWTSVWLGASAMSGSACSSDI
jgi:ABC-type spermidine/putrescine transport system permease subunit II